MDVSFDRAFIQTCDLRNISFGYLNLRWTRFTGGATSGTAFGPVFPEGSAADGFDDSDQIFNVAATEREGFEGGTGFPEYTDVVSQKKNWEVSIAKELIADTATNRENQAIAGTELENAFDHR